MIKHIFLDLNVFFRVNVKNIDVEGILNIEHRPSGFVSCQSELSELICFDELEQHEGKVGECDTMSMRGEPPNLPLYVQSLEGTCKMNGDRTLATKTSLAMYHGLQRH